MKDKLDCIMLVDDDEDCNFFHKRLIKRLDCAERIEVAYNGKQALDKLESERNYAVSLIFLDINMPVMDGWRFLEEYNKLDENKKSKIVVVMVTSSLNPDDRDRAVANGVVSDFATKYLSEESLKKIVNSYFP